MTDEKLIKPLWYLREKTLITILKAINSLNNDLKKEIITIITLEKAEEDYYNYEENYYCNMNSVINLSDYYFSI